MLNLFTFYPTSECGRINHFLLPTQLSSPAASAKKGTKSANDTAVLGESWCVQFITVLEVILGHVTPEETKKYFQLTFKSLKCLSSKTKQLPQDKRNKGVSSKGDVNVDTDL